jgi:hypothetical protein
MIFRIYIQIVGCDYFEKNFLELEKKIKNIKKIFSESKIKMEKIKKRIANLHSNEKNKEIKTIFNGLKDDLFAIIIYTYDLGEGYHENENFFYVLNEALRKRDHR